MHTPGPWASGRAIPEDGAVSRIVRAGDDHIAVVMDLEDAAQEAADNARLIAAAPDLLEALKAWLASDRADQSIIAGRDVDGHPLSAAGVARVKARAAIARATGGQ